jgi:hypothetical protein
VPVDFENRGMAIIRLCVSQSRQNIDGGPRHTMLYKRTSNIQVLVPSPEMGKRTANVRRDRSAPVPAKIAGSLELMLVICDNALAHFATSARVTNFSASLLVLRTGREKVC